MVIKLVAVFELPCAEWRCCLCQSRASTHRGLLDNGGALHFCMDCSRKAEIIMMMQEVEAHAGDDA